VPAVYDARKARSVCCVELEVVVITVLLRVVLRWWLLPYYYAGIKCYDVVSGRQLLKTSYVLSKSKALEQFPMLKADKLVAALVYYDGRSYITIDITAIVVAH